MASSCTQRTALHSDSSEQNCFMEKLMAKIFSFYDEQSLIDVTFKVSNPTALIPAHRLILAAASPYFEHLFNGDQGNNPVLEINNIDSDTFERLITFCYTGQTLITVNNVGAMLKAAIVLKLDDAVTRCVSYLMSNINEYSLQSVYTLERETRCELLKQKIIEYETNKFMEISQRRVPEARTKINMRLTEPPGVSAANCGEKTLLAICAGMYPKLLQYNKADDKWQEYASIEFEYHWYRTILKDDNLLFLGGYKTGATSNIVRSWNIRNKAWQSLPAMNQARRGHCVVELDGKIYAIGGSVEEKVLSSVERYTTFGCWQFVNSLIVGRKDASAVTLNSKIYILGGRKINTNLKSVECYNPDSNTWASCADMTECDCLPVVAAHNGHIYILVDWDGNRNVERYDPQQDTWSKIFSSGVGDCGISCVSLDNKLWVITGDFFPRKAYVSVYDVENGRWKQKHLLENETIRSCFVVPEALLTSNEY